MSEAYKGFVEALKEAPLTDEERKTLVVNSKVYFDFQDYMVEKTGTDYANIEGMFNLFSQEYLMKRYDEVMEEAIAQFATDNDFDNVEGLTTSFNSLNEIKKVLNQRYQDKLEAEEKKVEDTTEETND